MPYTIGRLKVEDYARWKAFFDAATPGREAIGSRGGLIFRDATDPNAITVLTQFADMQGLFQFVQFMQSPDIVQAMRDSGVVGTPEISFYNDAEAYST
jgi:hypothetical protein